MIKVFFKERAANQLLPKMDKNGSVFSQRFITKGAPIFQ